jgi:hypothetical protein
MYLYLSDKKISHSVELRPDTIILDVAEDNTVVGMELRYVSKWLEELLEPVPETPDTGQLVYMAP